MRESPVHLENVRKAYRRGATVSPVLCGVDLEIRLGECLFLVGPSGSGKTTLLSILGCILTPDEGTVRILGQRVDALDDRARSMLRRKRIGFVFQRFHLIRGLTVAENVEVPLTLLGVAPRPARRRALELLDAVGLSEHASVQTTQLSTGQRQRVALARALSTGPELILADEPTAALDAESGLNAMRLLRRVTAEADTTVVVVTHDPRIFSFADRVLELNGGRLEGATVASQTETVSGGLLCSSS
jgi:putative ABC transport system ATP-binding protein